MQSKVIEIKDLKPGDYIKSFKDGKVTWMPVLDVWETIVEKERQVDLYFTNGTYIHCSTNHPIMVLGESGIEQKYPLDLTKYDMIISDSGFTYLESIEPGNHSENYIDITVDETNVFFAQSAGEGMVLTHNCSQGGVRGGAATLYYPIWHLEVENLLVLKNNKGVDENRIRHLDYGIQINDLMLERLIKNDYITLFSPDVCAGLLYSDYFRDSDSFRNLYETLERDQTIRKKRIKALELFELFFTERSGTARIYPFFVDNVNKFGPFIREVAPIKQSNLCAEIALPTKDVGGEDPEIALCTLSAFVLDSFDYQDQDTINELAEVMVRALDNLLDYQDYPVKEALKAKKRRALGVGVTNYAGWLASNFATYDDANDLTHELFERLQYGLIKASIKLAKEKGPCEYYSDTRWSRGELPIDWYNKKIDQIAAPKYVCDWSSLREDLKLFGIRNSTLSALMPCESSSQVSNSTNGIEPPRGPVSVKESKEGSFNQVVPNIEHNIDLYDYLWKMTKRGMKGYLTQVAIMQKFVCQSISSNFSYDPQNFSKGKVPMSVMMEDMLYFWALGGKTAYYHNTRDGSGTDDYEIESSKDSDCASCKL